MSAIGSSNFIEKQKEYERINYLKNQHLSKKLKTHNKI